MTHSRLVIVNTRVMVLPLLAGIVLALTAGPTGLWYLIPVALAGLLQAIDIDSPKRRFLHGFIAFGLMFAVSLAWTRQFNVVGWPLLALLESIFFALACAAIAGRKQWQREITFVAALTLGELARIYFPLGGLPIGGFTTATASSPLAPLASVVGEVGMVTVFASLAVGLRRIALQTTRRSVKQLLASLAIPVLSVSALFACTISNDITDTSTFEVATVQAGGPQALRRDEQQPERVFDEHYALTEDIESNPDFIAWPEDIVSVTGDVGQTDEGLAMSQLARELDTHIGAGVVERVGDDRFRNAFVVWGPSGEIVDRYEKRQRVPFGEYVPARSFVDRFADLSQVPRDAIVGTGSSAVEIGGASAAVAISYEGLFSRLVRDGVNDGGQFVLIPTNAASYESPRVARTQIEAARFRALETGRDVVQSAPTGISAFIDNEGNVVQRSGVGGAAVLTADIQLVTGRTIYTIVGDVPLTITASAVLLTMWATRCVRRGQDRDPAGDARTESD